MFKSMLMTGAVCSLTAAAIAEPISYQGFLRDGGQIANGIYDVEFKLYDTQFGGNQVGPTQSADDLQVVEGVFRHSLEFGDVFDGQELWLRLSVRPGAETGTFTALLPRQKLTQVPKAAYATVAETALNSVWQDVGSDTISFGDGVNKVLINRTNTIASTEYFGVHAGTTGFGGMFVSTEENGFPMYAYAEGDELRSYTFYRHLNDAWVLWVSGANVLEVKGDGTMDVSGGIEAAGPINADAYSLNAPRTLTYSVSGDAFHSGSNSSFLGGDPSGGAYQSQAGSGWLIAPVNLPDGATVTAMHATYLDNAPGNMTVTLEARLIQGTLVELASVSTSGTSTSVLTLTDTTINDGLVDNASRGYHLRVFSASWPGNLLLRVFGVRIEYTVNEVQ